LQCEIFAIALRNSLRYARGSNALAWGKGVDYLQRGEVREGIRRWRRRRMGGGKGGVRGERGGGKRRIMNGRIINKGCFGEGGCFWRWRVDPWTI